MLHIARCKPEHLDLAVPTQFHTPSQIMKFYPLPYRFASNGGFFGGNIPEGIMAERGTVYPSRLIPGRPCLYVENGEAEISPVEDIERAKRCTVAIGGGPMLLRYGRVTILPHLIQYGDFSGLREGTAYKRVALGIDGKGNIVHLVADSMTLPDVQQTLLDTGCVDAINMDSGGSVVLLDGNGSILYRADPNYMRPVPSCIVLREVIQDEMKPHGPPYKQVTRNFNEKEFACQHCGWVMGDDMLYSKLQQMRDIIKAPISITSGYRCERDNRVVDGAPDSYHVKGMAADLKCRLTPKEVAKIAESVGFGGIGVYASWVHVDTGPVRRW